MSEIVLINPPSPFLLDPKVMPPLGLLYVASALKKEGITVKFTDLANSQSKIPIADYYGITSTTAQYPLAKQILQQVYQGDVAIGGPHATLCPNECWHDGFDAIITGEGEKAVFRFLQGQRGVIHEPFIKDLDEIAFPDRSLVADYHYTVDGQRATTMVTSRGCYWRKCVFCCQNWPKVRYRSYENVRDEINEIKSLGYKGVMIYDDEFFTKLDRDYMIAWHLLRQDMVWRCFSRSDLITEEVGHVAGLCACKEVLLGIESGSRTILKTIKKGVSVDTNIMAIDILHANKIRVKAAMIVMLPGESRETLRETWAFCEKVEPKVAEWDFTICVPYPGSPLFESPEHYDFYFDKDTLYTAYKGGGSPAWQPPRVWTSSLTTEEGLDFRERFEQRFKFHRRDVKLE